MKDLVGFKGQEELIRGGMEGLVGSIAALVAFMITTVL
jgi:hypothetical protein